LRNKKNFETEMLLSQNVRFEAYKMYITVIFTHLVLKLNKKSTMFI